MTATRGSWTTGGARLSFSFWILAFFKAAAIVVPLATGRFQVEDEILHIQSQLTEGFLDEMKYLDVDIRVGDYTLDNTHNIRGGFMGFDPSDYMSRGPTPISLSGDPLAVKQAVWLATDRVFKSAAKKYQRVLTNLKTMVEEEDKSDDFTREQPNLYSEPEVTLTLDRQA